MEANYVAGVSGDLFSRVNILKFVRTFLRDSGMPSGYYLEFGVLNGDSMVEAWRMLRGQVTHFVGFDSFAGLPELSSADQSGQELMSSFHAGNFASMRQDEVRRTILARSRMKTEELVLVGGNFSESFKAFDRSGLGKLGQLLVVYVDCDLYSSSAEVFEFIEPLVGTGTWLFLDDYWCYRGHPGFGQRRAFDEWMARSSRVGATDYCNFGGWGKCFILHEK